MSEEKLEFYEMIINADKTHDVNYNEISKELLSSYKDLEYSYLNLWEEEKELVDKIDKAIEYIKNASYFDGSSMCANDLLEILGDKENE